MKFKQITQYFINKNENIKKTKITNKHIHKEKEIENESIIKSITPESVIANATSSESGSLAKGTGTFNPGNNLRTNRTLTNSNKFVNGDWIVIVLEDKYGKKLVDDIFKKMLYYSTLAIDFNNAINETLVEQIRYYVSELEKIYEIVRS